ncbi:MAG: hypothetical protein HN584_12130 [Akkermansiaceae bacterium]|nr:hypothetical protein [Akkermansiaceae bacterium]
MNSLKELREKRLLTSEVVSLFEPYKDAVLPLSLSFVSAAKSFGAQKDEAYNDGYSVVCNVENWEVEICLLFSSEENSLVESFESGEDFEVNVKFIDYDALYQRAMFGKLISQSEFCEVSEPSSPAVGANTIPPIELEAEAIDLEAEAIELEAEAIELEAELLELESEIIGAETERINQQSEDERSKSENRLRLLNTLNARKDLIGAKAKEIGLNSNKVPSLPQPSSLDKSGCWCLLTGGFVLMGGLIAVGDGMNAAGLIIIGLLLCLVGGVALLISKVTKKITGKD